MKTFLLLVLTVVALFLWQRNGHREATETKAAPAATRPGVSPARPVSPRNWARNSLDRAHQAADQVQESRRENQP